MSCAFVNIPYKALKKRDLTGFSFLFVIGRKCPAKTGTRKIATNKLLTRAITIVKIIPLNICPINPKSFIKKRNGINTQIVVRFPDTTERIISELPRAAATFGFAPLILYE